MPRCDFQQEVHKAGWVFFVALFDPNLSLSPRKGSSSCYFLAEVCDPSVTSLTDKASCTWNARNRCGVSPPTGARDSAFTYRQEN